MPRNSKRRPELVAFGGVVVDDVEDHLDPRGVQRLHHRLELLDLAGGRVAGLRGEEADRVVAPVVAQAPLDEPAVVDEGVHRHQLDGRHAEALQVVDDRRGREPGVGAAQCRRHVGMPHGEAAHVRLVDHRVAPRHVGAPVVAPGERGSMTLHFGMPRALSRRSNERSARRMADRVAEERVAPAQARRRGCARTDRAAACSD